MRCSNIRVNCHRCQERSEKSWKTMFQFLQLERLEKDEKKVSGMGFGSTYALNFFAAKHFLQRAKYGKWLMCCYILSIGIISAFVRYFVQT